MIIFWPYTRFDNNSPVLAGIQPVETHKDPKLKRDALKHTPPPSVERLESIEFIEEEPSPVPAKKITAVKENLKTKENTGNKRESEQLVEAAIKPHPKKHKPKEPVIKQHEPQTKQKESSIKGKVVHSKPAVELQAPKLSSKHKKAPIKETVVHHNDNAPVVEPTQIERLKADVKPPVTHTVVQSVINEQTAHVPAKKEVVNEPVAIQQIEQDRQIEPRPGVLDSSPDVIMPIVHPTESQPKPEKQVFPEISNLAHKKAEFNKHIDALETQVENLKRRMEIEAKRNTSSEDYLKLKAAYDATAGIHKIIKDAGQEYFEKRMSYVDLKGLVKATVNNEETRSTLEEHRGIKKVLEDIINLLPKLINSLFGTKITLFKLNTESINKIDAVADNVNKAGPGAS